MRTDLADTVKDSLGRALFSEPALHPYAVVDGAQNPSLPATLWDMGVEHHCLFTGRLDPEVAAVAPYLVPLPGKGPMFDLLVDQGWGKCWAIYLLSERGTLDIRKHLRTLTLAEMPDGDTVFFRFYDPTTLRSVVPLLDPEQRASFFGRQVVETYLCESQDAGEVLRFEAGGYATPSENRQSQP